MQQVPTQSDRPLPRLRAWMRHCVDLIWRRREPLPGHEPEPGVTVPPLRHPERLPGMLAAHGLTEAMVARVDAATREHMQRNCTVCPHGRTCDWHRNMGVSEALAPQYCRNIELIQALQDRHVPSEILNIPRHVRFRRRPVGPVVPRAVLDC